MSDMMAFERNTGIRREIARNLEEAEETGRILSYFFILTGVAWQQEPEPDELAVYKAVGTAVEYFTEEGADRFEDDLRFILRKRPEEDIEKAIEGFRRVGKDMTKLYEVLLNHLSTE